MCNRLWAGRPRTGASYCRLTALQSALCVVVASVVALGALTAAVASAAADLLYYDPFNIGSNPVNGEYAPFTPPVTETNPFVPLQGQNPTVGPTPFFSGPWIGSGPSGQFVQTSSLAYRGTPSSGGSVTTWFNPESQTGGEGRVGRYLTDPWTSTTVGTYYLSYMASYGTVADPYTNIGADLGFRTTEFWPEGGEVGNDVGRFEVGYQGFAGPTDQQVPRTARLHFTGPGTGGYKYLTDTTFNEDNDDTHLIVMKFELSDQPVSDTVSVFLDPYSVDEPVVPSASATNLDFTLSAMSTITVFGDPTGIRPVFDDLRVGTSYHDMIPPIGPKGPCIDGGYACYLEIISHMNLTGEYVGFGDVTGDGQVTIADYRYWKDRRTDLTPGTGSLSAVGVPEPTSWLLALIATMALAAAARHPFLRTLCLLECA